MAATLRHNDFHSDSQAEQGLGRAHQARLRKVAGSHWSNLVLLPDQQRREERLYRRRVIHSPSDRQ